MDAARELAELLERVRQLGARVSRISAAPAGPASSSRLREPQRQRQRDEPLLRAVVEVALQPPALGGLGLDDARARAAQLLLLALLVGDVDAVEEPALLAVLVDDRRHRPRDQAPLAGRGDPAVLVLEPGHVGLERVAHGRGVLRRGEQLPEEPAARVLVVRVPVSSLAEGVEARRSRRPGVTTQKMLFAVLTTVLRKSRWRRPPARRACDR